MILVGIAAVAAGVLAMKELFTVKPGIVFLSKQETADLLRRDEDGFVKSLGGPDLYARKAKTAEEYLASAVDSAADFSDEERRRITRLIERLDMARLPLEKYGMDASKFDRLPWRIAKAGYEQGLPHTRGDTIFLSQEVVNRPDTELRSTLVHEKVHVYQKAYPNDVAPFVRIIGYRPIGSRKEDPLVRANPDLDDKVYRTMEGKVLGARYRSDRPKAIWDVQGDASSEHPYEMIAYAVSEYAV